MGLRSVSDQATATAAAVLMKESTEGTVMAQTIVSWFICDGRYRVHAINAVGRRCARIVEIEDIDSGERFHGSARRLERLFLSLGSSSAGEPVTLHR
jgi:hypothetical protein